MSNVDQTFDYLLERAYLDSSIFAKTFYPERFHRPFDPIHLDILELIDQSPSPYVALAAPRGIGKTSIANLLMPTKKALYGDARYIVPVSASADLAMQQSENLKQKLLANELIRAVFGDLSVSEENNVGRRTFSKKQWVINVGGQEVCIMPRGAGQQIRGLLWRDHRPDYIIVDDLEDPDNIDSEEQREKKKKWFYSDLMGSVDHASKTWKIVVVGTILHQNSLLQELLDDPKWDSIRLELCDDEFRSNAPNVKTDAECKELYELYKSGGRLEDFFREYRNIPVPTGADAAFQSQHFKYYEEADHNLNFNPEVENILLLDPARTANMNSAESAIVAVGINLRTNAIYVRDIVHGRFHPDKFIDEVIAAIIRNNVRVVGLEVTGLHEFVTYPLRNELARANLHHVEVIELHARGGQNEKGKVARVRSLVPFYRRGLIYHNKTCCDALEMQLMSFPRAKRWDIMDALGYTPEILEIGQRFMGPKSVEEEYESKASVEAEFQELYDDDYYWEPLQDFRII